MRAFDAPFSLFARILRQQRHLYTVAHTRWPSSQKAPPTPLYERINGNRDVINQSLLPITAQVAFPIERSIGRHLNGSATVRLQDTHLEKMRTGDGPNLDHEAFEHLDGDVEKHSPESLSDQNTFPIGRSFTSLRDGSATVQLQKAYQAEKRWREGPDVARGAFGRMDRDGAKQSLGSRMDQSAAPMERSFTSLRDGLATVQLHKTYLEKTRRSGGSNHMVLNVFGRAGVTNEAPPNRDGVKQSPVPPTPALLCWIAWLFWVSVSSVPACYH
jgi:hypothetical protein